MIKLYELEREMIFAKANGKKWKYRWLKWKYNRLKKRWGKNARNNKIND